MPLRDPIAYTAFITDEGRNKLKLVDLQETEGKNFNTGEPEPRMKWIFDVWRPSGEKHDDQYHHFTSESLGDHSNGRKIAEALLGHPIDGMSGEEVAELVIDKSCTAMFLDQLAEDGETVKRSSADPKSFKALEKAAAAARSRSSEE